MMCIKTILRQEKNKISNVCGRNASRITSLHRKMRQIRVQDRLTKTITLKKTIKKVDHVFQISSQRDKQNTKAVIWTSISQKTQELIRTSSNSCRKNGDPFLWFIFRLGGRHKMSHQERSLVTTWFVAVNLFNTNRGKRFVDSCQFLFLCCQ